MARRPSLEEIDEAEADDPSVTFCKERTPLRLDYAWKWFSYHAQQRLTAFHYFLLVVALLTTGYVTALQMSLPIIQAVLCGVGVVISVAFLALDIRNEELVNDGRAALRKLERALDIHIHRADYKRANVGRSFFHKRPPWGTRLEIRIRHKHGFWLRLIEATAAALFSAGLAHALPALLSVNLHSNLPASLRTASTAIAADEQHARLERENCLKVFPDPVACGCFLEKAPTGVGVRDYVAVLLISDEDLTNLTVSEHRAVEKTRALSACFRR